MTKHVQSKLLCMVQEIGKAYSQFEYCAVCLDLFWPISLPRATNKSSTKQTWTCLPYSFTGTFALTSLISASAVERLVPPRNSSFTTDNASVVLGLSEFEMQRIGVAAAVSFLGGLIQVGVPSTTKPILAVNHNAHFQHSWKGGSHSIETSPCGLGFSAV